MEILQSIRLHFRVCGLLPLNNISFDDHKIFHFCQSIILLLCPFVSCCILFPYIVVNANNFNKTTNAVYVFCGFTNAFIMYSIMAINRKKVLKIFNQIQEMVNERKSRFGIHFTWMKKVTCDELQESNWNKRNFMLKLIHFWALYIITPW